MHHIQRSPSERVPLDPVRWFVPAVSSSHLELLPSPVLAPAASSDKWLALSQDESDACEQIWLTLTDEEKKLALVPSEQDEKSLADERMPGVPIGKEKLFEVDVRSMRLVPIYWKASGEPMKARRVTWFYDINRPVEDALAEQLSDAYSTVMPWRSAYAEELEAARSLGAEGYDKIKYAFKPKGSQSTSHIMFEDADTAQLISGGSTNLFSTTLLSVFRKQTTRHPLPLGTLIYRGYDRAVLGANTETRKPSPPPPSAIETADEYILHDGKRVQQGVGDEENKEVTDLILIVHGIGQGIAANWESFNFLYASNLLRQVTEKQRSHPAIASVMRSRRLQFLPVLWRANFKLTLDEEYDTHTEENQNRFTLEDITLNNKIPLIRDIMNNVLIDVPFFMSHHRERMISTVCLEANRIYRHWCARHPEFETNGRVHILGHSLGSVIAAHILSNQPTLVQPLSKQAGIPRDQLLFNTSSLFMLGSPLGVFVHLNQARFIARKGRERTMDSPSDEALDKVGVFGCLSVDSMYNVFNASDPVAYRLNPAVDAELGRKLLPSLIPNITGTLVEALSSRVSKMFSNAFVGTSSSVSAANQRSRSSSGSHPSTPGADTGFELGAPNERIEGTKAERRFRALNPHGTLDFYLPSEGNISEYLDMLSAHSSYWGDANFAAFLVIEICSKREDIMRTGLVPIAKSRPTSP